MLIYYSKFIESSQEREWIEEQQRALGPKQSLFTSRSVDKLSKHKYENRSERSDKLSFNMDESRNSSVASPVKSFVSSFFKMENNEIQETKIRSPRMQPATSF